MTSGFRIWRVVAAEGAGGSADTPFPDIATLAPRLAAPGLPDEVAMLLPNRDGSRALMQALEATGCPTPAVGLFLADPFLRVAQVAEALVRVGVSAIAALPSVAQHDSDLYQQLSDVGLDAAREAERLAAFRAYGLATLGVACDPGSARVLAASGCDAVLALPKVADFAAGFPSLRQRSALCVRVRRTLAESGWAGRVLALATDAETARPGLWPDGADGFVCRPAAGQADRP